jgi:hypothetical protein
MNRAKISHTRPAHIHFAVASIELPDKESIADLWSGRTAVRAADNARRLGRVRLINQFVHDLSKGGILLLLCHRDRLGIAVMRDAKPGLIPFDGVLSPFAQGEIVRDPEQRSTYSRLVFVAWRVNNYHAGRYQAKARREVRFRPTPDNCPVGTAQRQCKVNRGRAEQNSPKLSPANENRRFAGCDVLGYPQRDQIRAAKRQRIRFDIRPRYHVFNQVTQCSVITMVIALNVEWAANCDRSLTPPIGKTGRNSNKIFCAFESIHILRSFLASRMASTNSINSLEAVLCFGRRFLYDSIG